MSKNSILVIEDEKSVSRIIELELKHQGYKVDLAFDGKEGLIKIAKNEYDLVLLDIMIPEISGIAVCREVRKSSDIPIIMLTAKGKTVDKVIGLDAGADDYITKPFSVEELLARIRANLRRTSQSNNTTTLLKAKDLVMDLEKYKVFRSDLVIELRKKEFDLLEYLIRNKDIVLSRGQILENVWGYDYSVDTNVVDVYVRYLRSKIDDQFEDKLIHTIRGVGYILREYENEK